MLNKQFLQRKIKLIQEDLSRLEPLAKYSLDQLAKNSISYNAAERLLEKIITRAIDINRHCIAELGEGNEAVRTYEDTFLRLAKLKVYPEKFAKTIAPSAGLRNVLAHEYDEVDKKLVAKSIKEALFQYAKYCDYILKLF